MIKYKTVQRSIKVIDKVFCDKCKKEITDDLEIQEVHSINFVGGYSSIFGDGYEVDIDLCQHCLYELIKDFYAIGDDSE